MFARSPQSTFICLKCRLRLSQVSQRSKGLSPNDRVRHRYQKRWQSLAAAVVEDAQDYAGDNQPSREDPRPPSTPQHKYKGRKVWKPKKTANLGVSSLGEPAEVLLLHERDRLIPQAPADVEEGREGDVLPQAWNTENMSLSPEQVMSNIEQIRDQVAQSAEKLNEAQQKELRKKLQHGFSAKQLLNYIEQRQVEAVKPFRQKPYNKKFSFSAKNQMAKYIFQQIWGVKGQDLADRAETAEKEDSKELMLPMNVLEVLLSANDSSLKLISSDHGVQIDVFRQPARIVVSGPSTSVRAARTALQELKQKVKSESIPLGYHPQTCFMPDVSSLFAEIRQQQPVHLQTFKKEVVVSYHIDRPPDIRAIRRQLLLAQKKTSQSSSHIEMWPKVEPHKLVRLNMHSSASAASPVQASRSRFIASENHAAVSSVPQMSDEQRKAFSTVYKSTHATLRDFKTKLARLNQTQSGFRIETRASFGQAIIKDGSDEGAFVGTAVPESDATLITQIPLLTQFLANRKPWKAISPESHSEFHFADTAHQDMIHEEYNGDANTEYRYQLVLNPVRNHISHPFPRIIIQLSGADVKLGLKQPLQIKNVSAVLGAQASYLLLPSKAADIKFENRLVHEVYREGTQSTVAYGKLLAQLVEYFDKAVSEAEPSFPPFTKLSMPFDVKASSRLELLAGPGAEHEYVLSSAQALDVASYRPPFKSNLCLDYIILMGDQRMEGRQVLQLAEQSLLSAPTKKKTTFASFFNSAYEIALQLGSPASTWKS